MATDLNPLFESAAKQYGLPVNFLKAIAQQESSTRVGIQDSNQGAKGLMQMLPATAAAMGAQNPYDPVQAIPAAARYLREGLDATGSLSGAAAYYHGGPDRSKWGPKTANYVQSVGAIYGRMPQPQAGPEPRTVSLDEALGDTGKAPAMASDDFDKRWGIGGAGQGAAADSGDDFDKRWGLATATQPQQAAQDPGGDKQGIALGAGLANGVPVVGPYVLSGLEKAAAAGNAVLNNSRYSDELDAVKRRVEGANKEHPYASTAGNIVGAVGGMAPLGATALGARALGMAGPTMTGRMFYGALGNGALGGADAAVRGENPLMGAGFGLLAGGAAPVVGEALGRGANMLLTAADRMVPTGVDGMSRSSANMLGQLVAADDPAAVRAALAQHGPQAMLADAGPSLGGITEGLATKPSDARSVITKAITGRAEGATGRLAGDINGALGPAPVPSRVEAALANARETLGPEYQQVMRGAGAVNTEALANNLESSMANLRGPALDAARKVRGFLNIPGTNQLDPNPQALLATRQAIDGLMANEQNPQVVRQLTMARQAVDGELGRAVPGIKDVDAKYAELMRQSEALQQGGKILDSGKTAVRPQELAQDFPASANPQGTLVGPSAAPLRTQQGARAEIDRLVGTNANDLSRLQTMLQGEGGWNTQKLGTVFGEEPTNQLLGAVNREATFARTTNDVLKGPQSARRLAANKLLEDTQPGGMNLMNASLGGMAAQAGKSMIVDPLIRMIMESPNAPRNLEMARALTAQGATRDQILNQILRLNARQGALASFGGAARNAVGGATNRLLLASPEVYNAQSEPPPLTVYAR